VAAGKVRVTRGLVEISGLVYEETADSAALDTNTAGDFISGVSEKAANTWLYVYVKGDTDGGWTAKLSDDPPLYPDCNESFVFTAQVTGNPAPGATSIAYDGDTGETSLAAGDVLRFWTDSGYTTVRGGLTLVSVNTGTNTLTVEANGVDLADDDYITAAHGIPRYRKFGSDWYRCTGALRLDGSQNVLHFFQERNWLVLYDDFSTQIVLSAGTATSWTTLSCASYIPPIAGRALFFGYISDDTGYVQADYRKTGSSSAAGSVFVLGNLYASLQFGLETSPAQEIDYIIYAYTGVSYGCSVYVGGFYLE